MARTKDFDEDEVLDKAIALFWHKGYNGTSMQDLIDSLGISRSSLYDTYTDKHTLYVKALERYQQAGNARLRAMINDHGPAKETVKKLLALAVGDLASDQQQKGCFMVNAEVEVAPHDRQISQLICKNDQQMEDLFFQVIKKGQDSGEIGNGRDARALARFIFNNVKGMRVTARTTADRAIFEDIMKLTVAALD